MLRHLPFFLFEEKEIDMAEQILTEGEIKELERALKDAATEEGMEAIAVDWQVLKNQAMHFLRQYENLEKAQNMKKLKNIQSLINNPESATYIKMKQKNDVFYVKAKYLLAFQFDNAVNKFVQGLPKEAVYVFEDKKTGKVSTYKMSMTELAKHANAAGRLFVGITKLKAEERKSIEEDEKSGISDEHIAKSRAAYMGVTARLNRYYEKKKEGMSAESASKMQQQGGILMWKMGRDWTLARVLNKGDIKEAYAAALLSKHKTQEDKLYNSSIGEPDYYSHELISNFYESYITGVTNQAAIAGEDIVGDDAQYGVKSVGARMPSLNQYLEVAKWVASKESVFTVEELKAFIDEKYDEGAARNIIIGTTGNMAEATMDELLTPLEKMTISKSLGLKL